MSSLLPLCLQALSDVLGVNRVQTDPAECWTYSYDNSRQSLLPAAVIHVLSHEEAEIILGICYKHRVPVTARGRGTGTVGGSIPCTDGIVLSFERMQRIISFRPEDRLMVVEAGVTNQAVQDRAAEAGLFWSPDPSSAAYCTVGGNLAYNSAGPRAVKYGTPRENVLGLRAVTGDGQSMRTGVYTTKGVVGYDLTRLLVGSEGTLALITEATLKLLPKPEAKFTLQILYSSVESATEGIIRIMSSPCTPCVLEFMDSVALDLIRTYQGIDIPIEAQALLIVEVDGSIDALSSAALCVKKAAQNAGLIACVSAQTSDEVAQLWQARKALSPILRTIASCKINEDVVVPMSKLAGLMHAIADLSARFEIKIVSFGHAGNGNIHVNLLFEEDAKERALTCLAELFSIVLKLEGSLSGEHGVGLAKKAFVEQELDGVSLALMRQIKALFDPANILNPGKVFPEAH